MHTLPLLLGRRLWGLLIRRECTGLCRVAQHLENLLRRFWPSIGLICILRLRLVLAIGVRLTGLGLVIVIILIIFIVVVAIVFVRIRRGSPVVRRPGDERRPPEWHRPRRRDHRRRLHRPDRAGPRPHAPHRPGQLVAALATVCTSPDDGGLVVRITLETAFGSELEPTIT